MDGASSSSDWLFVAKPCTYHFSRRRVLAIAPLTRIQSGHLQGIIVVLTLLQFLLGQGSYLVNGATLTRTAPNEVGFEEYRMTLPHVAMVSLTVLVRLALFVFIMHLANRDMWMKLLFTFDAMYIMFNYVCMVILRYVSIYSLYHEGASGAWYLGFVINSLSTLPLALVVASLDSIRMTRRFKIVFFLLVIAYCLFLYFECYTDNSSEFSNVGTCAFGLECKEYKHYYKTSVLNIAVFVTKAIKAHASGWDLATIRAAYHLSADAPDAPSVLQLQQLEKQLLEPKEPTGSVPDLEDPASKAAAASLALGSGAPVIMISTSSDDIIDGFAALRSEAAAHAKATTPPVLLNSFGEDRLLHPGPEDTEPSKRPTTSVATQTRLEDQSALACVFCNRMQEHVSQLRSMLQQAEHSTQAAQSDAALLEVKLTESIIRNGECERQFRQFAEERDALTLQLWENAIRMETGLGSSAGTAPSRPA